MKNAAKCDTSCELHASVSHQNFERNLHPFLGISVGVFVFYNNINLIGICVDVTIFIDGIYLDYKYFYA